VYICQKSKRLKSLFDAVEICLLLMINIRVAKMSFSIAGLAFYTVFSNVFRHVCDNLNFSVKLKFKSKQWMRVGGIGIVSLNYYENV